MATPENPTTGNSPRPQEKAKTFTIDLDKVRFSRTSADWVSAGDFMRWEKGEATPGDILCAELERRGDAPPTDSEVAMFEKAMLKSQADFAKQMAQISAMAAKSMVPLVEASNLLGLKGAPLFTQPVPDLKIRNPVVEAMGDVTRQQAASNQLLGELVKQVVATEKKQEARDNRILRWTMVVAGIAALTLVATGIAILASVLHW